MFCQKCGAIDNGGVRCSICGSNDYGPNKPELSEEQVTAKAAAVPSNKAQVSGSSSSSSSNTGCAFIIALIIVGVMWLFGAFDY
jgi:uncharacterized membrane protein YvbJ